MSSGNILIVTESKPGITRRVVGAGWGRSGGAVHDYYFFHHITGPDLVHNVNAFENFTEYRMLSVEVLGVFAIVTYEELRPTGVPPSVSHG